MSVALITAPGVYPGFDVAAYFADPCPTPSLTQSIAKVLIERSPAHARLAHPRLSAQPGGFLGLVAAIQDDEPEKYDAAKAIGNAAHALMIRRGKIIAEGKFDNWRSKDAKDFRDEAQQAGRIAILSKHLARAFEMVKAASAQLDACGWGEAFTGDGHGEVVIAAIDDGIWLRSLIDWMHSPVKLYDFKSSGAALAPHTIGIKAAADGWDIQAAMQERILDLLDPDNAGRRVFRFPAIENEEPYALIPVELTEAWLTMGRKRLDMALRIWRRCLEADDWPAWPGVTRPEYPGFVENRFLAREISDDERGVRRREPMLTDIGGG